MYALEPSKEFLKDAMRLSKINSSRVKKKLLELKKKTLNSVSTFME